MSLCPVLEADRLDALSISNCPEVGVVSVHNALSFPKGGVPSQCSSSEHLCGSLDVLSCDANSGDSVEFDAIPPRVTQIRDLSRSVSLPRADVGFSLLLGSSVLPPVSNVDSPNCGLGIPPPDADEFPTVDSVDQSSEATPFKALD
ncbi:hypothetical protein Nepgr_018771 [Nepenthes gracilis]|uniref:Uncharacterized protein n=1 Tax=Nepenthes gracilis TaxID=150966 RepID=A0AAD3SU20_NEPGR|nr:hypothetical protein Nepgr_018771 [Nepenthes gracilis]